MTDHDQKEKQDSRKFDLVVEFRLLQQKVEFFTADTTDFRNRLDKKLDIIFAKLDKLPCDERRGLSKSVTLQLTGLWVVAGSFAAILYEMIKK